MPDVICRRPRGDRGPTVLVLAGGRGTRLRPSVPDRPKVLAEVHGRPWITFLLEQLEAHDLDDAVLCTGYRGSEVAAAVGQRYGDVAIRYSRETEPLGTGGAIVAGASVAGAMVAGAPCDGYLVLNGDSYCDVDLSLFAATCEARHLGAAIVLSEVADTTRFGHVTVDEDLEVTAFHEKRVSSGPGLANAGIYWFSRAVIESWPRTTPLSLECDVLPELAGRGLTGWITATPFLDIGTPESYAAAAGFFARSLVE